MTVVRAYIGNSWQSAQWHLIRLQKQNCVTHADTKNPKEKLLTLLAPERQISHKGLPCLAMKMSCLATVFANLCYNPYLAKPMAVVLPKFTKTNDAISTNCSQGAGYA